LNASTGAVSHSYATGGWVTASPAIANGLCYVGSQDNNLYAMYLSDGFIPWVYVTGAAIVSASAIANGVVYVNSGDGNLYALNASNGALIWQFYTGDHSGSPPIVANGLVFVPFPTTRQLLAINAKRGVQEWSLSATLSLPALAAANSLLYFFNGLDLYAAQIGTGSVNWIDSLPCEGEFSVANGVLYMGCSDVLYALNSANGDILWQYSVPSVFGAPTVVNGTIYVGDLLGNLYAFGLPVSAAPKAPARPALGSLSPNLNLKPWPLRGTRAA
jgi:eukaryotic-like serine/threonine-protein kinase